MTANDKKQFSFVLYPGLTPLDLIGPLRALATLPRVDPVRGHRRCRAQRPL